MFLTLSAHPMKRRLLKRSSLFSAIFKLAGILAQASFLPACAPPDSTADLKVTNGTPTSQFPSVIQLTIVELGQSSSCSGTFISDALVLTAAHCMSLYRETEIFFGSVEALGFARHDDFSFPVRGGGSARDLPHDLAVVRFPPNTSSFYSKIASAPYQKDREAWIVGYGSAHASKYEDGDLKRKGRVLIFSHEASHGEVPIYRIMGSVHGNGDAMSPEPSQKSALEDKYGPYSLMGLGDSGGPMLTMEQDAILGVASSMEHSGDEKNLGTSVYADVTQEKNRLFIQAHLSP